MHPGRCVLDTIIQRGGRQLQGKQRDDRRKVLIRASKTWHSNSTHKIAVKLPTACVGLSEVCSTLLEIFVDRVSVIMYR